MTREVVTRPAIRRLCELAQLKQITIAVDHPQNVADLSQAAADAGVVLRVLVELDAGMGRCTLAQQAQILVVCVRNRLKLEWVPIRTLYAGEDSHINRIQHLLNFSRIVRIVW